MNTKIAKGALSIAVAVALTGCSGLGERMDNDHASAHEKAAKLAKQVGGIETIGRQAQPVIYEQGIWIGKTALKAEKIEILPPIFNQPAVFDRSVGSIQEFAERVTAMSGYATKVTPDALVAAQRAIAPTQQVAGGVGLPPVPTPMAGAMPGVQGTGMQGYGMQTPVRITYTNGSLKGLLDTAASRFGVWWTLERQQIKFYYTDTKTFSVRAVPGDSALNATVSTGTATGANAGSTGSTGGTSTQTSGQAASSNSTQTQVTSTLSVWTSLQNAVKAMLTTNGQVVSAPATGSITVTDTPDVLAKVSDFIDNQNVMLSKQIVFNVTILGVSQTDQDSYGISWDLVYSDLFRKFGIKNSFGGATGNTALSAGVISPSSKWNGTTLLINALSQQGKVRLETTASVTALNNQPTPIQISKQTTYLASSSTTATANVGSTTSITPGTVNAGFSMTVLPSVMPDGSVILQFSTDISALRQIRQISSGGVTIEAPEIDTRNFLQRVTMKSGESLIVSGFEQTDDNLQNSGVGHPRNFLLGGGRTATGSKEVIVVIVTPVIVG